MQEGIGEILKRVNVAKTEKEKVVILQASSSAAMKAVVGFAYDPRVKWLLPETNPPFKRTVKEMDLQHVFYSETRKLYMFIIDPKSKDLSKMRREQLFIQMLETLDTDDADVLLAMKNKRLPGVDAKTVKKAFPSLSKNW